MSKVISMAVATVITMPFFAWYLAYITTVKITKRKGYAVKLASDLSNILFIAASYFIMYELWHRSFLWLICVIFFSVAIIFTLIHWKIAEDIQVGKLFRGIWRLNFVLFFLFYIILSVYGLFKTVTT